MILNRLRRFLWNLLDWSLIGMVTREIQSWFGMVLVLETDVETDLATGLYWYPRHKLTFIEEGCVEGD